MSVGSLVCICGWLISLGIVLSRLTRAVAELPSFFKADAYSAVGRYRCCAFVEGRLGLHVSRCGECCCGPVRTPAAVLSGTDPGVGLLLHVVILCVTL